MASSSIEIPIEEPIEEEAPPVSAMSAARRASVARRILSSDNPEELAFSAVLQESTGLIHSSATATQSDH